MWFATISQKSLASSARPSRRNFDRRNFDTVWQLFLGWLPRQCVLRHFCANRRWHWLLCLTLMLSYSGYLWSADISRDVRAGREDESVEFDGYLEISGSYIYNKMPIPGADTQIGTIGLGGHLRYKRFFIDAYAESYNQFQLGLNAYSGSSWSFDILAAVSEHGVDSELNRELKLFTDRDAASLLGARATGYLGSTIVQFEALQDISDVHNGSLITATLAKQWLFHNWNFHALVGARYESARSLDYQFGIDPDEATAVYPAYEAKSGTTFVSEAGLTYPLSENFIFTSTFRWWELPSAVVGSPFVTNDSYVTFTNTITFVY